MDEQFELYTDEEELSMHSPLGAIIRRTPVTLPMTASVREALACMDQHRIGAIILVDPDSERPRGIFTLQDLLRRVALKELDLSQPISSVMTLNLITMRPQSTAYQAGVTMSRRNVRHVLVTDHAGRLVGIVSQNDLYALQRAGVKEIGNEIRTAGDFRQLERLARNTHALARTMLNRGVDAEQLTYFISTLNDLLTLRILELTEGEFELPKVRWCWISLGSEGRFEQTFSTDQDNGIIFEAASAPDAALLRQAFLPFARRVNERLDACGFPLCKGDIMASNPQWCLSLDEWKEKFGGWIREAEPQALLNSTIFFDFRPLYGEESLSESLRAWLLAYAGGNPMFLRQMATNALQTAPPLGLIRDFVYDGNREFPHTIDLKLYGVRPFVDAARIFALAHGVAHTSTAERLRAVADKVAFGRHEIPAILNGFYYIQLLRMRRQIDPASEAAPNRLNPDQLNELDRHILKEAFRQSRKLQQRLQLDYRL